MRRSSVWANGRTSELAAALGLAAALAGCGDGPAGCAGGKGGRGPARSAAPVAGRETVVEAAPFSTLADLLAQRPLATVFEDDALVMDTAPPEIDKFVDGGWRSAAAGSTGGPVGLLLGERDRLDGEDRRVALADGLIARLRFPGLGLPRSGELSLWLRPAPDVPRQAMSVFLNERTLANSELSGDFQRYRIAIPEGRLLPGENSLRLYFRLAGTLAGRRSAAALARAAVGPVSKGAKEAKEGSKEALTLDPVGRARSFGIGGDARQALVAGRPTRWAYALVPPAGVGPLKLVFGYGVQTGGRPAQFSVQAQPEGGAAAVLWSGRGEPGRWQEAEVALPDGREGTALRLELAVASAADGEQARGERPSLAGVGSSLGAIAQPRLVLAQPPVAPAVPAEPPREAARAEHVVVFVVDALRADRVLPGKGGRARSLPAVAQLMQGGAALRLTSQGNFPLPAHASLLSGTYPAVHHMLRDDAVLPDDVPMLAEALRRAGFATGLFSGSGYVSERWGLRRGFDSYRNLVREGLPSTSGEVWKVARTFLEEQVRAGRRLFLYVAVADPHAPYNPPAELLARTLSHPYNGPLRPAQTAEQLLQVKRGRLKLTHEDRQYLEALYDAEVLQMDGTLGLVLADLQRLGIADKTALAFVGSHGEELLDHGSVGHGHSLYDELISVPLVLRFPARVAAGERDPRALRGELCDLMPTLLQLAGAAVPGGVQGESLVPLLQAGARPALPRMALSQHEHLRSAHLGRYHLIFSGERWQLFDLLTDPAERQALDTREAGTVALRALHNPFALFQAYEGRWNKARLGQPAQLRAGFLEELGP